MTATVPPFAVIPGAQVQRALRGRKTQVVRLVEATYRLRGAGDSVNPPFYSPWADPTELTGAALLLTDPAAGYLTGAVLPVDGGWTAH